MKSAAQIIKEWNSELYFDLLAWKSANSAKFKAVTGKETLEECSDAEISAFIILLIGDKIRSVNASAKST